MKKLIAFLLAVIMLFSLTACGGKTDTEETTGTEPSPTLAVDETGRTMVRVGIVSAPTTLAPWEAMSPGGIATRRSIYEFLVDKASFGGEMSGVLMESYEEVDDTTYNITIYDYIYDTEGNHMTASDVAFSYMKAKEIGKMAKLSAIESVTVISDYTAQFKFTAPLGLGDLETLWSEAPVVTQAAYEASPDGMSTTPVGTTAYKLANYISGSSITMEKTNNYWQTDESKLGIYSKANVDVIDYIVITESAQLTIALESGTIDISAGIGANDIEKFRGVSGYKVSSYVDNQMQCLIPNCSESNVMSNQALREAVFYAINANDLLTAVYGGEGVVATTFASSIYGDYDPAWAENEYFAYNVELAKQKLAEAGYKEGELTLRLICINDSRLMNMATIIQAFLGQIGINMKISPYENAMFQTLLKNPDEWDLCIDAPASSDYLISLWKLILSKDNNSWGGTSNFVYNDELQSLIVETATVDGHTTENMNKIVDIINGNAYYYALLNPNSFIAHTDAIDEVVLDFRNQIMPGCCVYNSNVSSADDLVKEEVEEPVESGVPTMGTVVDPALVAGTYAWSFDPGFGFTVTFTITLNADGSYSILATGSPAGDQTFEGHFESDGLRVLLGAVENDQTPEAPGVFNDDTTSWWFITGEDTVESIVSYTGDINAPAPDLSAESGVPVLQGVVDPASVAGDYSWSFDPGFGFTVTFTATLNADGTYSLLAAGSPQGDQIFEGHFESDGLRLLLGVVENDQVPEAPGVFNDDTSSWWFITGEGTMESIVSYTGDVNAPAPGQTDGASLGALVDPSEVAGTYSWGFDPGFGFTVTFTLTLNEDGTYSLLAAGSPAGDQTFEGHFESDGKWAHLGVVENGQVPEAPGVFEDDTSSWWLLTGEGTMESVVLHQG